MTEGALTSAGPGMATWSVADLHDAINGLLEHVFGDEIWVEGEIRNITRPANGHVYFDLADSGEQTDGQLFPLVSDRQAGGPVATLAVILFETQKLAVNRFLAQQGGSVRMRDGVRVRLKGRLRTYPTRSTLQLTMSTIDPAFTLGVLGLERDRLLAQLTSEGILRSNATLAVPAVPFRVAVVTSRGSAAHADVLRTLEESGLGLSVVVLDARTQGPEAPRSVASALAAVEGLAVDIALVVRGGGARTDLAGFDHELVARAIIAASVPVWTGIGHETDRSVADEVAHTAHKTPTACAGAIVERVAEADRSLDATTARVSTAARATLTAAQRRLDRLSRDHAGQAFRHVDRAKLRVDHLTHRTRVAGRRAGAAHLGSLDGLAARLEVAPLAPIDRQLDRLSGLAARARAHDVEAALRRGWTITRNTAGMLVRDATAVDPGDQLVTTTAAGAIRSRVEASGIAHDPEAMS